MLLQSGGIQGVRDWPDGGSCLAWLPLGLDLGGVNPQRGRDDAISFRLRWERGVFREMGVRPCRFFLGRGG